MKKRKARKHATQVRKSSGTAGELQDVSVFDSESYIRRMENLNAEVDALLVTTDSFRILKDEILRSQDSDDKTFSDIQAYLNYCVRLKDDECKALTARLTALQQWINSREKTHEDRVAGLLVEIDEIEERLGLEKTVLNGKIASMEDLRVQRDEMQRKFSELQRLLDETVSKNRKEYYQRDLETALAHHRLLEEMKERVRNLVDEFHLVSGQRKAKVQLGTVDKNCRLHRQLSRVGAQLATALERNKALQSASNHLQRDVSILQEVNEQMRGKLSNHLKVLEQTIQGYQDRLNDFHLLHGNGAVQTPRDFGLSGHSATPSRKIANAEEEVNDKGKLMSGDQLDQLKAEYEQMKERINAETTRLNDVNAARHQLDEMVSEVTRSIRDAHELFNPEAVLTMSEKEQRKSRLMSALLVLLSTSDLLNRRQLGMPNISRSTLPHHPPASTKRFRNSRTCMKHCRTNSSILESKIHHLPATDPVEFGPQNCSTMLCAHVNTGLLQGLYQQLSHEDKPPWFVRSATVQSIPHTKNGSQCSSVPEQWATTNRQESSVRLPDSTNQPRIRPYQRCRVRRILNCSDQERLPSLYTLSTL